MFIMIFNYFVVFRIFTKKATWWLSTSNPAMAVLQYYLVVSVCMKALSVAAYIWRDNTKEIITLSIPGQIENICLKNIYFFSISKHLWRPDCQSCMLRLGKIKIKLLASPNKLILTKLWKIWVPTPPGSCTTLRRTLHRCSRELK